MELYKHTYTKEEADGLVEWMDREQPSGEIDLGEGVYINDIKLFCKNTRFIIANYYANYLYSGQICVALNLREAWEKRKQAEK